jgi:hypothetical protein
MDALLYILGRIDIEAINERPEPVLDQLVVQLLSHRARIAPAVAEEDHPLALLQAERFMYEADNPGQGVVTQPCLAVERVKRRWRMRLEIALVVYDGKHENAVGQGLIDLLAALCRRRPGRAAQVHGHGGTIAVSLALGDVAFADLDRASRVAVNGYGRIKVVPERPHPGPAIGMDAVHGVGHLPPALRPGLQPSTIPSAASCLTSLSARQIAAQTSHRVLKRYRVSAATQPGCLCSTSMCMRWLETVSAISASNPAHPIVVRWIHRSAPTLTASPSEPTHP